MAFAAPGRDCPALAAPGRDCPACPRLVAYRADNRRQFPDWHNAPVDSFGDLESRLLVVGLAPGLRGANRTGRPFTGDFAGDLLYRTLAATGFAVGDYGAALDDGLVLNDCRITNVVRCAPPGNRPLGQELAACNRFLAAEIKAMAGLRAVLALGRLAHDGVLGALGRPRKDAVFGHGATHALGPGLRLYDSYHCSRLNTNTGRLTEDMFHAVANTIRADLG